MPLWFADAETKDRLKADWNHIASLGLHEDIRNAGTEEQQQLRYLAAVIKNAAKAENWLAKNGGLAGDLATLAEVHEQLFRNVHPPKNIELRDEPIYVGFKEAIAPEEMPERLQQMNDKLLEQLEVYKDGSRDKKAEILAEYHCGLKELQLFMDGNGRTARLFLDHQLDVLFGTAFRPPIDSKSYELAMQQSLYGNNHAPMTAIISEIVLHSRPTETKPTIGQQIEFANSQTKSRVVDM